ncbi:hypothetical protein IHE45_05G120600 [Dioscorea alata]|uniref:Uncharacterized protein n=1 Tax=Dioscorea alata TaxID=55571 RepID=A0ACB7W4W4_DIOAL|nr:hypothetical protein IHE45_05G120600 [Dioscorea alata]
MDAVELPLPATVGVSKLLSPTPDGFPRARESEKGPSSSVFGTHKPSGSGSYHKAPEYSSISRNKRSDADFNKHDKLPSFRCVENESKRHHPGETDRPEKVPLDNDGKQSNRKTIKNPNILPCSKRLRTDQPEHSSKTIVSDACDDTSIKMGLDLIRCNYTERSRMTKPKRCLDTKRTEKKNLRACGRLKYEAGLVGSDLTCGANNIIGLYGLKSDPHDVVELVDEVSLSELLDGSYIYPKLCPDKGKKTGNSSESIPVSVRKACSILMLHASVDSSGSRKASTSIINLNECSGRMSDSDSMLKTIEESEPSKGENLGQANSKALCHPKEILDRLALSPVHTLDSLLLDSNMPSFSLQSATHMTTLRSDSLPPFSWSVGHNGVFKTSTDSKLSSTRITCQGRWLRLWNNSTSIKDCCFPLVSDVGKCDNGEKQSDRNRQMIDDLVQYVNALSPSINPPEDTLHTSHDPEEAKLSNIPTSNGPSGALEPCNSLKHSLMQEYAEASGSQYTEGDFRCQEKLTNFDGPFESEIRCVGNVAGHKDPIACSSKGFSDNCYPCKSSGVDCSQNSWCSSISEAFQSGYSPRAVAAAEILCEMANCFSAIRIGDPGNNNFKWPKAPSQKTMKARKSMFPTGKTDEPFLTTRHTDPIRSAGVPSTRHKLVGEKNSTLIDGTSRSPVRWSVSADGASSGKPEREIPINRKPLLGSSVRPLGLSVRSPTRFERDGESKQKLRSFGGIFIKDWSRGSKRF